MDNILYIDDYINLYNKKTNQLIVIKPYKSTLKNGFIIDRDKFIKKWELIKNKYNLKSNIFEENIYIIINNLYSKEDKNLIINIMENLNYKKIKLVQEIEYLKVKKDILYVNYNYSYFYFLYTNNLGNIEYNLYKNDNINKKLIINIIEQINKNKLIIYGKNYKELENILKYTSKDYYYFEKTDNLLINLLINEKKM